MTELLEVYDLDNNLLGVRDRKEFYDEIRKEYAEKKTITKKLKRIGVLILTPEGRVYLQKRSNVKAENPGLYDKTIGGHISSGESPTLAVVRECAEELGIPSVVLSKEEFGAGVKSTDLEVIGVLQHIATEENDISRRKMKEGEFAQPYITHFYIGYYNGSIRFRDGESSGLETFSAEDLKMELQKDPDKYTQDLHDIVRRFGAYLKPL